MGSPWKRRDSMHGRITVEVELKRKCTQDGSISLEFRTREQADCLLVLGNIVMQGPRTVCPHSPTFTTNLIHKLRIAHNGRGILLYVVRGIEAYNGACDWGLRLGLTTGFLNLTARYVHDWSYTSLLPAIVNFRIEPRGDDLQISPQMLLVTGDLHLHDTLPIIRTPPSQVTKTG
ncbi:hypothetical protein SODALDRAFT_360722 [Sodiomyces alkalinus F11]|uniref:Uncharacterized protein n=1 Tax=Sodiomyces alkalinus (strain CBS 110278 / VKM F-3762 / F11) TaxID=1314773 RepID=A0A3N2PRB4_SODAK|nr:hypothetical protein SODALDRAFT_360722 [Sodiomyces alkalinus F11]ROT37051.1 hypothetical protein SODALDRAFT_360722 [Sodiomyces alkalinus F11]